MKKKIAMVLMVTLLLSVGIFAACGGKKGGPDVTAPVITAQNVPTSGLNGRPVTVPAVTAADEADGDLSAKVKLTVAQLKANGEIKKEVLYQVAANVENTFVPSGSLYDYSIVFSVKDSSGNKAETAFTFKATPDTEAPVLSLNLDGFDDFDTGVGITGKKATEGITIPKATAVDKPGDVDISDLITVSIINDETEEYAKTFYDIDGIGSFRLLKGSYTAVYGVSDLSGNAAPEIRFPIVIDRLSDGENLLHDPRNFTAGFNSGRNMFGDVFLGMNGDSMDKTVNCSCLSFNAAKLHDEIVGVRLKADAFGSDGGEMLYDFSYRGSKNNEFAEPTGKEGEWAPYFVLRADKSGMAMFAFATASPPAYMNVTTPYSGTIADGVEHTVFFQVSNDGDSADAEGAKIVMKLWVDVLPTAAPVMVGEVVRGNETKQGMLIASLFDELWNARGWLSFGAISGNKDQFGNYSDDGALLKGLAIYDKEEKTFGVDIVAPTLTFAAEPAPKYNINEKVTFVTPTAVSDGTDVSAEVKTYLLDSDGSKGEPITGEITVTQKGNYTLVYEVADRHGNIQYETFDVKFIVANGVPPVITVDKTEITVSVGQEFTLPAFSAGDDLDGDITEQVVVDLEGPQKASYINFGGKTTFRIYALGRHELVYRVADLSDNETEERVTVNVSGEKSGNLLENDTSNFSGSASVDAEKRSVEVGNEKYVSYNGQQIYDKKVSAIVNVTNGKLFMINVHGANNNNGIWTDGMTVSFATDGMIYLSLKGYNEYLIGSADKKNPFVSEWYQNIDVRIDFLTSFVLLEDVEYMSFELWVNDEAIEFTAKNEAVVSENKLMIAVNETPEKYLNALGAGFFFLSCQEQSMTLKELRIDGSDCETPALPEIPKGFEYPEFGESATVGDLSGAKAEKDQVATVLSASNQDEIYLKFKVGAPSAIYTLQVTDSNALNPWGNNGFTFILFNGNLYMGTGYGNKPLYTAFPIETGGEYYLEYKLTYLKSHDLFTGLQVEAWKAVKTQDAWNYEKATWSVDNSDIDFGTDMSAPVLPYTMFGGKNSVAPSPLVIGALNDSNASIQVLEASVNEPLPITEGESGGGLPIRETRLSESLILPKAAKFGVNERNAALKSGFDEEPEA